MTQKITQSHNQVNQLQILSWGSPKGSRVSKANNIPFLFHGCENKKFDGHHAKIKAGFVTVAGGFQGSLLSSSGHHLLSQVPRKRPNFFQNFAAEVYIHNVSSVCLLGFLFEGLKNLPSGLGSVSS